MCTALRARTAGPNNSFTEHSEVQERGTLSGCTGDADSAGFCFAAEGYGQMRILPDVPGIRNEFGASVGIRARHDLTVCVPVLALIHR